jgi:hypothetical protein
MFMRQGNLMNETPLFMVRVEGSLSHKQGSPIHQFGILLGCHLIEIILLLLYISVIERWKYNDYK